MREHKCPYDFQSMQILTANSKWIRFALETLSNLFASLGFAIPTKFDDEPSRTSLYQGDLEGRTGDIVQQLSKMIGIPIWLSINAECQEERHIDMLYEMITRKCIELLEKKPECWQHLFRLSISTKNCTKFKFRQGRKLEDFSTICLTFVRFWTHFDVNQIFSNPILSNCIGGAW